MLDKEILVDISPDKKYPIFIDYNPISSIEDRIFQYTEANKVLVVVSEKVDRLYKEELDFKKCIKFVLKDGESQKNFENFKQISNFASKHQLERKDAIVAIGGGVVGDLAGFVASTYMRGIDFIQVPTTLLACVDSSVGGKVAINTNFGKNLVGTFYQPKAVFCNLNFLKTLDDRQFKTGLAEVLKYAYIEKSCMASLGYPENYADGYELFEFLHANPEKIFVRNLNTLAEVIYISLLLKVAVVCQDEKEQGLRKILNFGHTLGHALEKITNYRKYTHGEAIAIGMKFALELSFQRGLINDEYKIKADDLIRKYSLVKRIPRINSKKIIELMQLDKKVENGHINFVLPTGKSAVSCFNDITSDEIQSSLKKMKI